MSPNPTGIKPPRGVEISLETSLSLREKIQTGSCQCWVKGSLGPSGTQTSSCSAFGVGDGGVHNERAEPRGGPRVIIIIIIVVAVIR